MRSTVTFVIGFVIGAIAILLYLEEKGQLAIAAEPAPAPMLAPVLTGTRDESLLIPVRGVAPQSLRSTFNDPRDGHLHAAIDIHAPRGTPVLAAVPGTIRKLFTSRSGGLTIYEFDREERRAYYYAHLDHYAEGIREGSAVAAGQVIGYVGTSGNASPTAPHLHFAVYTLDGTKAWWKGHAVDPYALLVGSAQSRHLNSVR